MSESWEGKGAAGGQEQGEGMVQDSERQCRGEGGALEKFT